MAASPAAAPAFGVQLRLEELKPVANRLSVEVLAYPGVTQYDNRFDVLANDVALRLYPTSDLGDPQYPKGRLSSAPPSRRTAIPVTGRSTAISPSRSRPTPSWAPATTAGRCPPASR
ncbi:hypothetical protein BST14_18355 [Mycobacterium arosiense ATCC BAA-1401 = DSM 45069]|uniref:Uncharacterized protein n=1 Tax=Mycobacterium arosiense ATCC BAA-1401 = DSM 45069 TaxID=1265311 RepID=A0A1W9ZBR5_MYCAI|nr:hypothetical protein BST14_18355 [Mycobacterium arosiense ATCC BAA-1401 = DSM 45069]